MWRTGTLCALLMCAASAAAQGTAPPLVQGADPATALGGLFTGPSNAPPDSMGAGSTPGLVGAGLLILTEPSVLARQSDTPRVQDSPQSPPPPKVNERFDWNAAMREWAMLLAWQNSIRMFQPKTRAELGGPFWSDYVQSLGSVGGWGDGDSGVTNYVLHPWMGAVSGYIQIQNDPAGRPLQFGVNRSYWRSRGLALAAAAIYSAQFEWGPVSEASIGNVGMHPGTMGLVDMFVTPLAGFGLIVAEDVIDRYIIEKGEARWGRAKVRLLRSLLNPNRSVANIFRIQVPWKRDTRGLVWKDSPGASAPGASGSGSVAVAR
jgi:hypothetical protein